MEEVSPGRFPKATDAGGPVPFGRRPSGGLGSDVHPVWDRHPLVGCGELANRIGRERRTGLAPEPAELRGERCGSFFTASYGFGNFLLVGVRNELQHLSAT